MCEPAYNENNLNLNFRLVFLQELDTFVMELVLNILYMPLGPTTGRGKICSQNDTFSDSRLQRSKPSNNSDR